MMLLLKLCFLCYLLVFLLNVAIQLDPTLTFWDNCKKNEIMQKWPISFINLFFWNLSCTINCVQFKKYIYIYIYSYMSKKHPLPANCMSLIFEENSQITCCCCCCFWFVWFFCFVLFLCDKLIFKRRKGEKTRLLFTDWKIIALYTTEILT